MNYFYADITKGKLISWNDLLKDIRSTKTFSNYCQDYDFYNVFKQIIISLIIGKEIVLLDANFSEEEITHLLGKSLSKSQIALLDDQLIASISSKDELLKLLQKVDVNWAITLFTSGTTGQPKKISHSYKSITRFVKKSDRHTHNVWGFAYNPTHMAGIQVFFQALLNGNSLVKLYGLSKNQVFSSILKYSITNISATPSFYRLLLPESKEYSSIKRLTSGGEKFDERTINALKQIFPNAKITNVYASTEAGTLLASNGNDFSIKPEFKGLIRIEENELLIHKSIMGNSDAFSNEWYYTGDMVEIVSQNPLNFRFISRKNEMINVGGYKVNPHEVEDAIREINGILDVRVFAKNNSVLGNIIGCEIVKNNKNLDESTIRIQLQNKLQEFKIPRFINFVRTISTTRTGKVKRN